MIVINGRLASYAEIWFDEERPRNVAADVLIFRQRPAPLDSGTCTPFLTLVSDLSMDETRIMEGFGNTNRYKIRRAETKDGLEAAFVTDPLARLDEFCEFYDAFAREKSMQPAYRRGLVAASAARQLVLTSASRGGEPLVWHAYVISAKRAALLHSASHFRGRENSDRALCGRANRWLHWRDMLSFRQMGLLQYDWGGLFENETDAEHASINHFKSEFGGRREQTYECTLPLTAKGRLYLLARGTLERLKERA